MADAFDFVVIGAGSGGLAASQRAAEYGAKVAVVDDTMVYIGSMNLDPRSESTNTELGIVAQCPQLASDVIRVIDAARRHSSYRHVGCLTDHHQCGPNGDAGVDHNECDFGEHRQRRWIRPAGIGR